MKANNNTIEITNGVEYRVILSIEGKKNLTTIFTTRKGAKAAIKEMERDLEATNTGYVIRLICNVYEDGELVTNSELGRSQFDPSKVITVKVAPTETEKEANETLDRLKSELQEYYNNASKGGADRERNMQWLKEDIKKLEQKKAETKSVNDIMNQANRLQTECNAKRNFKRSDAIRKIAFRYFDNIRACAGSFNSNDDSEYNKQYSRAQYMAI